MKLNNSAARRTVLLLITCILGNPAYSKDLNAKSIEQNQDYSSCIEKAQAIHPRIISCMKSEIETRKNKIDRTIGTASKDTSIDALVLSIRKSAKSWDTYANDLCITYSLIEGQRGELLRENCILNEITRRESFIDNILEEASI